MPRKRRSSGPILPNLSSDLFHYTKRKRGNLSAKKEKGPAHMYLGDPARRAGDQVPGPGGMRHLRLAPRCDKAKDQGRCAQRPDGRAGRPRPVDYSKVRKTWIPKNYALSKRPLTGSASRRKRSPFMSGSRFAPESGVWHTSEASAYGWRLRVAPWSPASDRRDRRCP